MLLELKNVTKSYKKGKLALDDFSAELSPGIYGLLGANGAGKTTLMNIITDNISADSGEILYDGRDVRKMGKLWRSKLGYMPQQQGLYDDFTANRFLWYMAALKGLKKKDAKEQIEALLKTVDLQNDAHKNLGGFSGGMKQRILIAQALLGEPEILILDEPTAGLDPRERIRIRNRISEIANDKIVILVTHVVSDIECIADRVILMKNDRLIKNDSPTGLIKTVSDKSFEVSCTKKELHELQSKFPYRNVIQHGDGMVFRIVCDDCPEGFAKSKNNIGLEDVYLYYFDYMSE